MRGFTVALAMIVAFFASESARGIRLPQSAALGAQPRSDNAADAKPAWRALPGAGLGQMGDVCFVDEQRAWMTTSDGSLLKSADGGKTWNTVPVQRGDDAWSPLLIRLQKRSNGTCYGWAVSGSGHIYHTPDGETWSRQASPFSNVKHRIGCLDVLDEKHAWVSGYGLNWRTKDGGTTWEHLSPKLQEDKTLPPAFSGDEEHRLIHFRDENHGTAVFLTPHSSAGWGTRITSDGGKTWKTQTKEFPWKAEFRLTVVRSGRTLRVYTDGGTLIYGHGNLPIHDELTAQLLARETTSDGDPILPSWDRHYSIVSSNMFAAVEMVGEYLKSLRISHDRGQNWSRRYLSSGPTALYFSDRNHGCVIGGAGRVSRTTDGGDTWSTQFLPTDNHFRSVCFADAKTGWIGGQAQAPEAGAGSTSKSSPNAPVWHTDDGGRTWKRIAQIDPGQQDIVREEIRRLMFVSRLEGWAVTHGLTSKPHPYSNGATPLEYGRILHTLDGGRTWKQVYYGTPLINIAHRGKRMCAVGYGCVVSNDGKTWKNVGSGTLLGVAFVDRDKEIAETEVIAVGESGTYARSTNGGLDWKLEKRDALQRNHLDVVTFTGPQTGWIAGFAAPGRNSGLFKTTDGGKSWSTAEIVWPGRFENVIRHHFRWLDLSAVDATHAWGIGGAYGQPVIFRLDAARPKTR